MALSTFSYSYFPRRSPSKPCKANYLIIIPGILAFSSFLLILIYISTTTNSFNRNYHQLHHHQVHHHPVEQNSAIIITTRPSPRSLTDDESELSKSASENEEETDSRDDDVQKKPEAALLSNLTTTPAIQMTTLNGSSIQHHNTTNSTSSSTNNTIYEEAEEQEDDDPADFVTTGNLFHDEEMFLNNYQEMNKTFKIYVYPHSRNHPFANALLPPPDNQEPGGNYASEAYFKKALMNSHFITKEPSKADLFFLPFSIATLRHDKRVGVSGLQDFISSYIANVSKEYPYWNRTGGADHFYVACHSIGRYAMEKATVVKMNAIQVLCSSNYFLPNYVAHKDVCLPQIWPRHGSPNLVHSLSKRKKLAFFAGAANSPVRKKLVQVWKNDSDIFVHGGRLKTPYADQLLGTKFCLHVKGFEVNTARIGDALYYACVPVVLADYYDLPFMDILNWQSFSVVVSSLDIHKLKEILQEVSSEEYDILQGNVLKARRHFQWNSSPLDFDAFYMVMYELWIRRSSIRIIL